MNIWNNAEKPYKTNKRNYDEFRTISVLIFDRTQLIYLIVLSKNFLDCFNYTEIQTLIRITGFRNQVVLFVEKMLKTN